MRGVLVVVSVLCAGMLWASSTEALTITNAQTLRGSVAVTGRNASPGGTLTWEGQIVGQARSNGVFSFTTTVLPPDCVGELSDGLATARAVIKGCGPVGPQGQSGFGLALFDADGKKVGDVVGLEGRSQPTIAIRVGDELGGLITLVGDDRFVGPLTPAFESSNCTGEPLMDASPDPVPQDTVIPLVGIGNSDFSAGHARNIVLAPDFSQPLRTVTIGSYVHQTTLYCQPGSHIRQVRPARVILDIDGEYRAPFRVR